VSAGQIDTVDALRAYTPDDAKVLKVTASTFPKSAYEMLLSRLDPQTTAPEQGSYPQGGPQAPTPTPTKVAK
jgi:hypothetical protein